TLFRSLTSGPRPVGSGLETSVSGLWGSIRETLPAEDAADVMRLAVADGQLQSVAQRDHPALTGECAHLPDVVDIHDRIPMNSLELGSCQALFHHSQRLGCKQPLFRGDNPNQFPLRLKGQHVVTVQEEILLTAASHDLCAPERVGWLRGGRDRVDLR